MEFKGTKGEWKVRSYEEPHGKSYRIETEETYIAEVEEFNYETLLQDDEAEANAKAISAIPELIDLAIGMADDELNEIMTKLFQSTEGRAWNKLHQLAKEALKKSGVL